MQKKTMTLIIRFIILMPTMIATLITGIIFILNSIPIILLLSIFKKNRTTYIKEMIQNMKEDINYILQFLIL